MKQRVADYIAAFLIKNNITDIFTVTGGGAMHLNDAFGHNDVLHCVYNHHEQASAMAADAYARIHGTPAVVCVTSGPGSINALNGVTGAYLDSIPMLVISGQMKRSLTTRYTGLKVRSLGGQEFDIIGAVGGMTKYAEMIVDESMIRYCLEKAFHTAVSGRPGPCWLDIPLDIQSAYVDDSTLKGYEPFVRSADDGFLFEAVRTVVEKLRTAKRPVLYAGNGIRLSDGMGLFAALVEALQIPVVTCWNSIDLISSDDACYCGRGGTMGDRAGNFAVQNSDLLICIGTRLSVYQVGYNVKTWARAAYTVVVDIDPEELRKPTVRIDLPVCADAAQFMSALLESVRTDLRSGTSPWLKQCGDWKHRYPVVGKKSGRADDAVNVYTFMDTLSRALPEGALTVVANGSASVVGSQSYYIKKNSRFIMNCAVSSMGWDLPAAIGTCVAAGKSPVYCIAGDGSIMMNLQELQTISTNKLPIKIFIINNGGYHQIRQTQNNIFHNGLVGVGPESNDLGFPDFKQLASAFDIPYCRIETQSQLNGTVHEIIRFSNAMICEIFVSTDQVFEPKSATKKLADGSLFSPPLEDMSPFLSRSELAENMYIPLVSE
ncbi:thiamine pyrophosphate-binding protein [Treponema brennaborense]|uniref:Acetolactate synthase n=1 Tax=Treponema brennaborense (strain DSM 12168 / CIP 105900 / DD5/3) TaxID=906968 RepID=F4LIS2_TREBD|nr:thiamine pyrophosphate-binding protein [Treponema brennaborense]AEE16247.1 Acetolactate synthase [Treponema brennaborense DSM 12168]